MASKLKERWGASAVWPAILSGLVAPGLGQLYNREYAKGGLLLFAFLGSFLWFSKTVTEAISLVLPGSPDQWTRDNAAFRGAILKVVQQNPDMFVTFEILILVVWVFGTIDAYLTARRQRRTPEPPDETTNA
jgi:hypothetical protein